MSTDLLRPLLICGLVLTEVGLWQWRMILAMRGRRAAATALGAVGAVLQITAINQVVAAVADPLSVGGYAAGVGLGVLFGMLVGDRLTPGTIGVTVVADAPDLAAGLWRRGWSAVALCGGGRHGGVDVVLVSLDRRHRPRLHRDVAELAPGAFWAAGDLTSGVADRPVELVAGDALSG